MVAGKASLLLAGATPFLLPALLKVALRADLPWPLLAGIVGLKTAAALLAVRAPARPAAVCRLLSPALTLLLAAAVLTGILITPYAAYRVWFESVREGLPRGSVSNLFVLLAALYSSSSGPLFLTADAFLPPYLQALTAAGLLAVARQETAWYALLGGLLAAGCGYLAVRHGVRGSRWRGLGVLLGLLALAAAGAWLSAGPPAPRGSRVVDARLHPGLRRAVTSLFPRFPLLYGLPGFGQGFPETRLGGTPVLSEAPILAVEPPGAGRLYLRTAAYDRYDGGSWSRAAEPPGGTDRPAGEAQAAPGAGFLVGEGGAGRPPAGAIRITVRAEYYGLLPHTLDTRRLHLPAAALRLARGGPEAGFRLEEPLRRGQVIWLERAGPGGRPPGEPPPEPGPLERAALLQLPEGLPAGLPALARSLSDPGGDRIATLRRLERYLADNHVYDLRVRRPPAGRDFVAHFLFDSREGYCVHFASAFVVLARLNGIPARYATGFLTPRRGAAPAGAPPGGQAAPGQLVVTGLSAHAWPEVWLEEHGWTTWEATTAVNPDYYAELERGWAYRRQARGNRLTARQLQAVLGRETAGAPRAGRRFPPVRWAVLLPAAGLALAALPLAAGAYRRYGVLLAPVRPDRRLAFRLAGRIRRSLRRAALPSPEAVGWAAWGRALARARPRLAGRARRLAVLLQRLAYSSRPVLPRDIRFLRGFYLRCCLRRDPPPGRPPGPASAVDDHQDRETGQGHERGE